MTYYLRSGNMFRVTSKAAMDLHETLPVGTYTIGQNPISGEFYLERVEGFEVKGKIYGDALKTTFRILNTFKDRDEATGVMLSGEKGSGKTLQAKLLSIHAMDSGIPTIVINQPWYGEGFNTFIQSIEQPTIVLFDEFEKVYDERKDQEQLLTLFDGVYPSKKLFIITCNDKYRVNEHMRNRPGRIYYRLDYSGLSNDFIIEYCEDNLNNKKHIETLCKIGAVFSSFNFDMLKAMVEEMNRYNESPHEVMEVLNTKPELAEGAEYGVSLTVNGKPVSEKRLHRKVWKGNPVGGGTISLPYSFTNSDGEEDWEDAQFQVADLVHLDAHSGKFLFTNSRGDSAELVKVPPRQFDWSVV